MDCCDNKNITCKDHENICINCGTIHDYHLKIIIRIC